MTKDFTSVWTRETRQPKASGLTREQIVKAAIEILDADGLESLSMRKLGAKLDAGATSLYWYVANKEELLELALDEAWGMLELPAPESASWREAMNNFAYSFRATMLAHPWATALVGRLPSLGPNALRVSDLLRRTFTEAGFRGIDVYMSSSAVMSFVLGQVIPEIAYIKTYGIAPDTKNIVGVLTEVAGDYPELLADAVEMKAHEDPNATRALAFDYGLLCVLDGLEVRLRNSVDAAAREAS